MITKLMIKGCHLSGTNYVAGTVPSASDGLVYETLLALEVGATCIYDVYMSKQT